MASIKQMGPASWRAQIRIKGHAAVCQTFKTEKQAQAWAEKTERAIRSGKKVTSALTIEKAVENFRAFRDKGARPISRTSTEHYYLNHITDGLGHIEVDRLTAEHLINWCRDRADLGAGPSTMSSEVSKLGTVLRCVSASSNTPMVDVVTAARPLLEYNGLVGPSVWRERRPKSEELDRLKSVMSPLLWDIVQFAIATAMRRGEIARIEWSDLDADRRCVLVRDRKHPRAKKGNHMLVPLTSHSGIDAWALVQSVHKVDVRIFPVTPEWVSDSFKGACDAAGIVDLHFHDLRHEATSRFFEAGLAIQQVAVLTGHKNWANLRRYTNIRPESLHAPGTHPGTEPRPDSPRT